MPKHLLKRFLPHHEQIRDHRHLRVFGQLLLEPNLWHLNRRSVAGAFANGLFVAYIPFPLQMVIAAGTAILFRVNLPLSVALVWITNPLTIPPMFYFAYLVGNWLLGGDGLRGMDWNWSLSCMLDNLAQIWLPMFVGSLVCATICAIAGYLLVNWLWRWHVIKRYRTRHQSDRN